MEFYRDRKRKLAIRLCNVGPAMTGLEHLLESGLLAVKVPDRRWEVAWTIETALLIPARSGLSSLEKN